MLDQKCMAERGIEVQAAPECRGPVEIEVRIFRDQDFRGIDALEFGAKRCVIAGLAELERAGRVLARCVSRVL